MEEEGHSVGHGPTDLLPAGPVGPVGAEGDSWVLILMRSRTGRVKIVDGRWAGETARLRVKFRAV